MSPCARPAATIYVVVDDPDKAVEISEWESAEAQERSMQSEAMNAFATMFELLAAPPSATVVEQLHQRRLSGQPHDPIFEAVRVPRAVARP